MDMQMAVILKITSVSLICANPCPTRLNNPAITHVAKGYRTFGSHCKKTGDIELS